MRQTIDLIKKISDFDVEAIVYDQASTDGSREYLLSLNDDKIKPILSEKNVGNCISRNEMINKAKYKYVLLLDADIVPIKFSIERMVEFLEVQTRCSFVGYDFVRWSKNWDEVTEKEDHISITDVKTVGGDYRYKIALTQYGMFRKECLLACPFPTFYPFDREGWGAEDDMVGQAIIENKIGLGAIILKRTYFHNKSSSIHQMGQDTFQRMYMKRYAYFKYYQSFLTPKQKIFSLSGQKMPVTKLKCNQYHWTKHNNLGDVATWEILKSDFPFLEFDRSRKDRLLVFGGTLFDHVSGANKINGANFKKILFFGVGASKQQEIDRAKEMLKGVSFKIVPRGPRTKEALRASGIPCEEPCGDVTQMFSSRPLSKNGGRNIKVMSPYGPNDFEVNDATSIKVANNNKDFKDVPFIGFDDFFGFIDEYDEIHSSQVHPFFMAAMVGKPCSLHPIDWRAEDFQYFGAFKCRMSEQDSMALRLEAQKNIRKFIDGFYKNLRFINE